MTGSTTAGSNHGQRRAWRTALCFKTFLKAYGGTGYSYLLDKFMPYLQTQGVTEEQVDMILVQNPKRVLTLAEMG